MTDIQNKSIQTFLDELASKSATPGGGSASALMGAQGAALISMACHLTIGKPQYTEVEAQMQRLLEKAEALRAELTLLIKADIDVFNRLMAAYRLPKDTEAEKSARSEAIQAILKDATEVPLACAQACREVMALSQIAVEKGSVGVVSDAGAAAMSAYSGLKTAALNVYINTGGLKDRDFSTAKLAELAAILNGADESVEAIFQQVKAKL
ncbi:MAG: cyclodeaminase/cyclohydrolase family protein [Methylovulum sp.]|uniref:methenyltetrahydrofolate cyclohydrolase n=1 Tax=Methylovulum sp. TaxID=1916980 RepID=UPI00262D935C|nr:methenyltetrahydrofolate cyclohydrolase [Methylovulum sp.]MDD2725267.1 cyclodeaminase/cyclohydrolase family protein [Methylovulum sp.]MDD5125856.1 cyclodeaminase/cyclohydrolase family protein [Methylovulum sp.]